VSRSDSHCSFPGDGARLRPCLRSYTTCRVYMISFYVLLRHSLCGGEYMAAVLAVTKVSRTGLHGREYMVAMLVSIRNKRMSSQRRPNQTQPRWGPYVPLWGGSRRTEMGLPYVCMLDFEYSVSAERVIPASRRPLLTGMCRIMPLASQEGVHTLQGLLARKGLARSRVLRRSLEGNREELVT
jgi:hypothetical protein